MITTLKEWCEKLPELMADKQEHLTFIIHDYVEVAYGWDEDFNKQYCDEHNIPYYAQQRDGGAIVCSKGNIGLGLIYDNRIHGGFVFVRMLDELCRYFKEKGLNAERNKNDILIDGYKVASGCGFNFEPDYMWTYEGIQISINQDLEAIKNICEKPMIKVPKALSEYGITTEEIQEWCTNWFIANNISLD